MANLAAALNSAKVNVRPGIKLVHRFRSQIVDATTVGEDERIIVVLASGKVYRSNKTLTRWYRIKP